MFRTINRSIKYKTLAIVLATTLVALLISALSLLAYEARNYRDLLLNDAGTQADIVARMAAPALQFQDAPAADQDLSLLASRRGIVAAAIYDKDGARFASYVERGAREPAQRIAAIAPPEFDEGALNLFHPIEVAGQTIGSVYIRSTDELGSRLLDYLLILGAVTLLSLGVAGLVSVYLQRSVSGPVLAVSDVARKIMSDGDFSLRAPKTTVDETGVLVDSFNTMLEKIHRATQELEETNRRLQQETEERRDAEAALRTADARKDEFLATLAHELRNPLAPMLNSLHIMEASGDPSHMKMSRDIIRRQLHQMVRLIDDLLDVSRITRGKLNLQKEVVDLRQIVRSAVETMRPFIESRKHTLSLRMPESAIHIEADAVRLSQVIGNLLNNAAKFTPPGGRIIVATILCGDQVEISVQDNGIGFPDDAQESMFEMFNQGNHSSGDVGTAGLGVGLGLARRIVTMHGGTIGASSPGVGQGGRFVVKLGIVPAPGQSVLQDPDSETTEPYASRLILVVDDNKDFANTLAVLLNSLGHTVIIAHDSATALRLAGETPPAIAFLDLGLPDFSGYELAERLQALSATIGTVLVAVSGWGQEDDKRRSRESGFAAHLVKPVGVDKIRAVLKQLTTIA